MWLLKTGSRCCLRDLRVEQGTFRSQKIFPKRNQLSQTIFQPILSQHNINHCNLWLHRQSVPWDLERISQVHWDLLLGWLNVLNKHHFFHVIGVSVACSTVPHVLTLYVLDRTHFVGCCLVYASFQTLFFCKAGIEKIPYHPISPLKIGIRGGGGGGEIISISTINLKYWKQFLGNLYNIPVPMYILNYRRCVLNSIPQHTILSTKESGPDFSRPVMC